MKITEAKVQRMKLIFEGLKLRDSNNRVLQSFVSINSCTDSHTRLI